MCVCFISIALYKVLLKGLVLRILKSFFLFLCNNNYKQLSFLIFFLYFIFIANQGLPFHSTIVLRELSRILVFFELVVDQKETRKRKISSLISLEITGAPNTFYFWENVLKQTTEYFLKFLSFFLENNFIQNSNF